MSGSNKRYVIFVCLFLAQLWTIKIAMSATATIAVASNFLAPAKILARQFEQQTDHQIKISAGSTGKLYAQIIHGAPYDAFFAANAREPKRAERESLTVPGSRFTYASGQLVLWSNSETWFSEYSVERFKAQQLASLSIANPKTAPYGYAAYSLIKKYHGKRPSYRLVRGENVGQAYQYVKSGNVDAGFVALSQVLMDKDIDGGSYWIVPDDEYEPIRQQVVLLKRGENNPAILSFLQFIQSEDVKRQLTEKFGYARQVKKIASTTVPK